MSEEAAADPDALAAELLAATAALTERLAPDVERLRGPRPAAELAGVPVAGVFEHVLGEKQRHRAGRPSPQVVALAKEAAHEAHARLGYGAGEGNPALLPLALAAFYVVEGRRSGALGLGGVPEPRAALLEGEAARQDPVLPAGARLLRVWATRADGGEVCVELRFPVA